MGSLSRVDRDVSTVGGSGWERGRFLGRVGGLGGSVAGLGGRLGGALITAAAQQLEERPDFFALVALAVAELFLQRVEGVFDEFRLGRGQLGIQR